MQSTEMRERQMQLRLSPEEGARLDAVAAHWGLNPQGVIRMLVKKEADSIGFTYDPPKPAKKGTKK